MEERCSTCRYFHELKELDEENKEWIIKSVCTLFPENESGYDAFAIVTTGGDMCECWSELKK